MKKVKKLAVLTVVLVVFCAITFPIMSKFEKLYGTDLFNNLPLLVSLMVFMVVFFVVAKKGISIVSNESFKLL